MKKVINNIGDNRVIRFAKTHKKEIALIALGGVLGTVMTYKSLPLSRADLKILTKHIQTAGQGGCKDIFVCCCNYDNTAITLKDLGGVGEYMITNHKDSYTLDTVVTGIVPMIFTK